MSHRLTIFARRLRKEGTDTEQRLWYYLCSKRFSGLKFRRQEPIDHYIADFCCIKERLIIELDGSVHDQSDQKDYDLERDNHLRGQGFRILRFRNGEVEKSLDAVLKRIREVVSSPLPPAGEGRCNPGVSEG